MRTKRTPRFGISGPNWPAPDTFHRVSWRTPWQGEENGHQTFNLEIIFKGLCMPWTRSQLKLNAVLSIFSPEQRLFSTKSSFTLSTMRKLISERCLSTNVIGRWTIHSVYKPNWDTEVRQLTAMQLLVLYSLLRTIRSNVKE